MSYEYSNLLGPNVGGNTIYSANDTISESRVITFDRANNGQLRFTYDDGTGQIDFRSGILFQKQEADVSVRGRMEITSSSHTVNLLHNEITNGRLSQISIGPLGVDVTLTGTKDLRINNDAGDEGQVIVSQGVNLPPVWKNAIDVVVSTERVANFSALVGFLYPVSTASNNITVTPPSSPIRGDFFSIVDSRGNASAHPITIDFTTAGQNLHSTSQNDVINTDEGFRRYWYHGTSIGWLREQ